MKTFSVNSCSLAESNLFLRALWAELRSEFGDTTWQYTPRRFGTENTIRFGWISLGKTPDEGLEVSIKYTKIGSIKEVIFKNYPLSKNKNFLPGLSGALSKCFNNAMANRESPQKVYLSLQIKTHLNVPLSYYRGEKWYCGPLTNGCTEVGILVEGFDEVDINHSFVESIESILDILSCFSNTLIEKSDRKDGSVPEHHNIINQFSQDDDWLDDFPIYSDKIQLSENQVRFIDKMLSRSEDIEFILRSCNIFRKALRIYYNLPQNHDVALSLFASSIEIIASNTSSNPSNCERCGQPQYKISQRVSNLAEKHLGEHVGRLVKEGYNRRSKYLHAGVAVAKQPFNRKVIPQLDPSGIEGCVAPWPMGNPKNFMEFSSFIVRKEIANFCQTVSSKS